MNSNGEKGCWQLCNVPGAEFFIFITMPYRNQAGIVILTAD